MTLTIEGVSIPDSKLAREVTERIHAGEFTWAKDFRDLHPSPFGHELYAKSVQRLFDAAWKPGSSVNPSPAPYPLPAPLDPTTASTSPA